jgi:hypothetical protein
MAMIESPWRSAANAYVVFVTFIVRILPITSPITSRSEPPCRAASDRERVIYLSARGRSSGRGTKSVSPGTSANLRSRQSALAFSIRSGELETKFQ